MNNIRLLDTELQMQTTRECLAQDLHTFGQVLLQIDDMYLTAKNRVTSFFLMMSSNCLTITTFLTSHQLKFGDAAD